MKDLVILESEIKAALEVLGIYCVRNQQLSDLLAEENTAKEKIIRELDKMESKLDEDNQKVTQLISSLLVCRKIFQRYAITHEAKNTEEGRIEAQVNQEHADDIDKVLVKVGYKHWGEA
jgi:hypothetical protein